MRDQSILKRGITEVSEQDHVMKSNEMNKEHSRSRKELNSFFQAFWRSVWKRVFPSKGNPHSAPHPLLISLCLLLIILPAPFLRAGEKIPQLLLKIEQKYKKAGSLEALFSQENQNSTLSQRKKTSSGKITIRFPSKLRWDTQKPEPQLLVSDGKTFWYYTPPFDQDEPGQLIERPVSRVQSELAHDLLSGSFSSLQSARITQETQTRFLITPKPGKAGTVKEALIEINPQALLIEKVILFYTGGHRSEISLTEIKLGKSLPDSLFHFKAPAHTDVIQE